MIYTALFYEILFLLLYLIFARKSTEYCSEKRKIRNLTVKNAD